MTSEFQRSVLRVSIREMRRALEDPETDAGEHAVGAAHIVGFDDDSRLVAAMELTGLPIFGTPPRSRSPGKSCASPPPSS